MTEKHLINVHEEVIGRLAECFGASPEMLVGLEGGPPEMHRFEGTLTGEYYVDERWSALKWYRMVNLTETPLGFDGYDIWCDWGQVWLIGEAESS